MRTYRLWPCDQPRTPRKPRRECRLVIIDLHIKRRNSVGWRILQVLPLWFLFVARYNISSFIKRLNFSNCAEWARSAFERRHERVKCARDFLAKTQFTGAVIWRIWTLADMLLADILPYPWLHGSGGATCGKNFPYQGRDQILHGSTVPC